MKVPFFSLQAGNINIIQPCNKLTRSNQSDGRLIHRDGFELYSNQYPEYCNGQLFLNGTSTQKNYTMLKIPANRIQGIVDLLKHYNEVN